MELRLLVRQARDRGWRSIWPPMFGVSVRSVGGVRCGRGILSCLTRHGGHVRVREQGRGKDLNYE